MKKISYIIFILILPYISYGEYKFLAKEERRVIVNIGSRSFNRISIKGDIIKEVIGDDNLYQIIYPTYKNHIFILPKDPDSKLINITIITQSNQLLDLSLNIINEEGKILFFEAKNV